MVMDMMKYGHIRGVAVKFKIIVVCICYQKMNDQNLEQRINIQFCVKLGKSVIETFAVFSEVYGTEGIRKSSVFDRNGSEQWRKNGSY
jgi:hypothetical protein